jgi:putative spermidine/putrescine transport system permease protein
VAAVTAAGPAGAADRGPAGRGANARSRRRLTVFRVVVVLLMAAFFFIPLLSMLEFSTRSTTISAARTLTPWRGIFDYPELVAAIRVSLELAAVTSVAVLALLVPTLVWVRLRLPQLRRTVEFLCLLPLTIPPIVLVVGLAPIYLWVTYLFGDSTVNLWWAYVILALPYVARALDTGLSAIDLRTLSEAARSLGATWATVVLRVVLPNISAAVLNSTLLTVSLVLGEFTFANLLNYVNFQVALNQLGQANAQVSIAAGLGSLVLVFVLLVVLSFANRSRRTRAPKES